MWRVKTMGFNKKLIHGVNVTECQYYSEGVPYFTNTEWTCRCGTFNTRCENYPNCYYKRFIRTYTERNRYRQALCEIEHLIQVNKKELEETLFNDYDDQILNIINKTKGEPNE